MATTDLGACEWFVWDLRRSNLIDRGQLDQIVSDFLKRQPRAEPPALAQFLVDKGILSQFQAERLLQGKTQGLVLGPYTLMDALGQGSMGTVYKAQSKNDNKWYAVKVLPRRSMWNVRIARRQVRAYEQCKHPAVVPFVDVGTAGGTHYLAWPMVEGETLEAMVLRQGRLAPGQVALYGSQVAAGMDLCHKHNLVHGLLKPSNLMVGPDQQVRILDLGIGSLLAESEGESLVDTMSTANSLTSGLDCASPESIMDPTQRTPSGDQYSLGCVLYFLLTGTYPFPEGTAVEKMMAHQTKQYPRVKDFNPEVPDELVAVVDRLLAKTPEERYPSMTEVARALEPLASSAAVAARLSSRSAPTPAAPRPRLDNGLSETTESEAPAPPGSMPSRPAAVSKNPTPPPRPPVPLPPREVVAAMHTPAMPSTSAPAPPVKPPMVSRDFNIPGPGGSSPSLEDRLGPLGMVVLTLIAAGFTALISWILLNR